MSRPKWSLPFDEPIELPNGKMARTLRQAADYVMGLPKTEHSHPKWQHAIHALILAAEGRTLMMIARIGMMQAINRADEPRWGPGKRVTKDRPWGKLKLARDR